MSLSTTAQAPGTVPDVVAPPPRHPRFPLADGVRGIAAILVVLVHVWLFTGGFGGFGDSFGNRAMVRLDGTVALFFLLSAFLLYRPMIAHRAGGPSAPAVGRYAQGRLLRIYPAYWVALTVLAVFPGLLGVFSDKSWAFYSLGFYLDPLFSSSICPVGTGARCGLPQSWTLTVEMTFYLALPVYAGLTALIARRRDVRRWVRVELLVLALLAAASLFLHGPPFSFGDHAWFRFSFAGHMYWIALGLAFAVLSVRYRGGERMPAVLSAAAARPGACWVGGLAIYGLTVAAFIPAPFPVAPFTPAEYVGLNLLQGAAAVLFLIPVVFGNPNVGVPARVLANPIAVWLGLVSYGIYLWHVTIAVYLGQDGADEGFWLVLIGTLVLAIPLAAASYYLIEAPLMRRKYRPLREMFGRGRRPRSPPATDVS